MSKETEKYGKYYWCVKVTEDLCEQKEIYVMADDICIIQGALAFMNKKDYAYNLIIPEGKWLAVFAASYLDGHAVAVEIWEGEVVR